MVLGELRGARILGAAEPVEQLDTRGLLLGSSTMHKTFSQHLLCNFHYENIPRCITVITVGNYCSRGDYYFDSLLLFLWASFLLGTDVCG